MKSSYDIHSELSDYDFSASSIAIVQSKYHDDITDILLKITNNTFTKTVN